MQHHRSQLLGCGADVTSINSRKRTPLHVAASTNSLTTAQILLHHGSDIESKDKDGDTPLVVAVLFSFIEMTTLLLKNGANIEVRSETGETPLHLTIRHHLRQMAQLLVEKGADLEARDENGRTAVLAAAFEGKLEVVRFLVDQGADAKATCNGENGIYLATQAESKPLIRLFAGQGVPIDSPSELGNTALMHAAYSGNTEIVSQLLRLGANVDAQDTDGWTPLHYASSEGHERVVEILLENRANPTIAEHVSGDRPYELSRTQNHDNITARLKESVPISLFAQEESDARSVTALLNAAESGHLARVIQLLDEGVDVNSLDIDGRSSLSLAAEHGWIDVILNLTGRNADLDLKDVYGGCPLWWAARNGHQAIVEHLIKQGACIDSVDLDEQSSLSAASQHGHWSTAKTLINNGANLNSSTCYGKSALHFASAAGNLDLVKLLLESGAHVKYGTPKGDSAMCLAEKYGHLEVAKTIEAHSIRREIEPDKQITTGEGTSNSGQPIELTPAIDRQYYSALVEASKDGRLLMIDFLLKSGLRIGNHDHGRRALYESVSHGHATAVSALIKHGVDFHLRDPEGRSFMWLAASQGHTDVVEVLHQSGVSLHETDNEGRSPILEATRNGHETCTSLLLRLGAKTESRDLQGQGPLWHAVNRGHVVIAGLLVEYGANIECSDLKGYTPLMVAVQKRDRILAKLLLEAGAKMRPEPIRNYSPLCCAADNGDEAIVDLLLDHQAELNYLSDNKRTALHLATLAGNTMVIRMLIEAGAKVGLRDADGRTALSLAKESTNDSAVRLLSQAGRLRQSSHKTESHGKRASYQYRALERKDHIRVLELHPGSPGDILCFDLTHVQLGFNASFEALSYEWRDKHGSVPVQCDDKQILITPNCKAAMETLRLRSKPRYLWIDAICINQKDDQERNQQVAIMGDIFCAADKVLMWLGEETETTQEAFEAIPAMAEAHRMILKKEGMLSSRSKIEGDPIELIEDLLLVEEIFEGFMDLVTRPYWTRAWIFPEIIIGSSKGIAMCGSQSCSQVMMLNALRAFETYPSTPKFPVSYMMSHEFKTSEEHESSDEDQVSEDDEDSDDQRTLGKLVMTLHQLNATDPRDKVFAALGLASTRKKLVNRPVADYTMTVAEVYVNATRYILDIDGITYAWQLGIRRSTKTTPDLPSWVPDFRSRTEGIQENPFKDSFLTSRLNIMENPITTETSLHIGGCIVDKVILKWTITKDMDLGEFLSSVVHALARHNYCIFDKYPDSWQSNHYTQVWKGSRLAMPRVSLLTGMGEERLEPQILDRTYARALIDTLMDFNEHPSMTYEELTSIAVGFLAFVLLVEDEQLPGVLEQIPDYAEQASEMWFDRLDNEPKSRDPGLTNGELMEKMSRYGTDIVFTENGYFGITNGGEASVDMVVATLGEEDVFRLLRRGAGPERYYEYVDELFFNFLGFGWDGIPGRFKDIKIERLEIR